MHFSLAFGLRGNQGSLGALLYVVKPCLYIFLDYRFFNVFFLVLLVNVVIRLTCSIFKVAIDLIGIHIPIAPTLLLKLVRVEVMVPAHQQKCIVCVPTA